MDQQKEPQIDGEQIRRELNQAKERLSEQAGNLSLKEQMKEHPYITLGVAFFSGALLSGSSEAREGIARTVIDFIGKEIVRHEK